MTAQEVINLMQASKSEKEWNANCDKVKKACGGYPAFWYKTIILSGIAGTVMDEFEKTPDIKISEVSK